MKMQFTVGMGRNERMGEIESHAQVAEESGFSHVTFVDQPTFNRDTYTMMALAARATHRIQIGHGVTTPATYSPIITANATGSIDELSGGRAFVGIGVGGDISTGKIRPMQELKGAILFIRDFMSGKDAQWNGRSFRSEWLRRAVPVYIGVRGPKACRLAGELADGVISMGIHPVITKWRLEHIEKGALEAGRDPSKIDFWARCVCYVANSKKEARRESATIAAQYVNRLFEMFVLRSKDPDVDDLKARLRREDPKFMDEMETTGKKIYELWAPANHEKIDTPHGLAITQTLIDKFVLAGPSDDICEKIEIIGKLGVQTVSAVTYTIVDKKDYMRRISDKIMPRFRN